MGILKTKKMKPNKIFYITVLLLFAFIINSCVKDTEEEEFTEIPNRPYKLNYGSFPEPDINPDNPLTVEGVKLGRRLFYEKMLSKDNTQSCSSCHLQKFAFSDTARFSIGVKGLKGKRQAMSTVNMAWNSFNFFWDGRAHLLRDQSLMPIQDPLEMDEKLENVVKKLKVSPDYPVWFKRAFGSKEINPLLISNALEQFMNSIVSNNSKYDQYLAGKATLTPQEERGLFLFSTEYNPFFPDQSGADCTHCHGGHGSANFENDKYMNNGLDTDASLTDIGREKVTNNPAHRGRFKVPTLRNVELTPPYMHDGRFKTLEQVIDHYNLVKDSKTLDGAFLQQLPGGLKLTASDKAALVAFLKILTDKELISNRAYSNPFVRDN
jgi:cytochrome c peroxidase